MQACLKLRLCFYIHAFICGFGHNREQNLGEKQKLLTKVTVEDHGVIRVRRVRPGTGRTRDKEVCSCV